jgi:hypothetical protein
MNLERYEINSTDSFTQYEFYSQGPKGVIKKIICFDKISDDCYNLSFGDIISETGIFSDLNTSNNEDAEKVLITIAIAVFTFTEKHPAVTIHAEGSSPSRTRLYRIYINKYWKIINRHFFITGKLINGMWTKFRKNKEYGAFAATRKNLYL